MPKRILVTGASGFIGTVLCQRLRARGETVFSVTRYPREASDVEMNLLDSSSLELAIRAIKPDYVVHLAWTVKHGSFNDDPTNISWLAATMNLARAAADSKVQRFIAAGTCGEYGNNDESLSERDACNPSNLYTVSKLATCRVLEKYFSQTETSFAWARLFFVYGVGEPRQKLISSAIKTLLDGKSYEVNQAETEIDLIYVSDVANALVLLLECRQSGIWNVCTGTAVRIVDVLDLVSKALLRGTIEVNRRGPKKRVVGDPSAIRMLGWRPEITLAQGIDLLVQSIYQ